MLQELVFLGKKNNMIACLRDSGKIPSMRIIKLIPGAG
jgi:hypothetical protein